MEKNRSETMKLRLRPCKREDGDEVRTWFPQERQMRMWGRDEFDYPLTGKQMASCYDRLERDPRAWGFTALDEHGRPVGSFQMALADYEADSIHMSHIVLAPEMRGQKAGQQMVSMAVRYAVEFLGMRRVTLRVFDSNPGAKRCYEKVGFKEEAYEADAFSWQGESWGTSLMAFSEDGPAV